MQENPSCSITVTHGLKEGNPLFDATVLQLVGQYLLAKVASLIGTKNLGFYRDDDLAVIHQANAPKMDRIWKDNIALFKSEKISISIDKKLDSNRLSRCLIQPRDEQVFP